MEDTKYLGYCCLKKGPAVSTTFTPICTLPKGHQGACNWKERIRIRSELIKSAAANDGAT